MGNTVFTAVASAASLSSSRKHAFADGPPKPFNFTPFTAPPSLSPSNVPTSAASSPKASPSQSDYREDASSEAGQPRVRNDNPRTTSAGFDPTPLERGVVALDELSKSPNTKKLFEHMMKKEETRQKEMAVKVAEFKAMQAQFETTTVDGD